MEQKYKVEQIFTKNYARLCAMTTAILHDSSLAQDAVQEGWIRLHKAKQLDTSSEENLSILYLLLSVMRPTTSCEREILNRLKIVY